MAHKDAIVSEERHLFPNKVNLLIRNKKHLEALMWVWLRACPRHYYSRTVNCFPSSADNWTEVYYYQLEAGQVVISGSARYALFIRDTRTSWTLILLPSLTFFSPLCNILPQKHGRRWFVAFFPGMWQVFHGGQARQGSRSVKKHLYPPYSPLNWWPGWWLALNRTKWSLSAAKCNFALHTLQLHCNAHYTAFYHMIWHSALNTW